MLGLSTTCILVWAGIYLLFQKKINELLDMSTLLMAAMFLEIWAHSAYQFWSNRERVNFRYKKLVAVTLTYVLLRPVLGVFCVLHSDPSHQVEARVLSALAVNVSLFSVLYFSISGKGKQFFNKRYWMYALRFNIPLLPHYLSQIVLNQSDRLMIQRLCGPEETAYYSVAYTLAMVLQILNTSVSSTMNPWIYKTIKKNEVKKIGKVSYSVLMLIALLNIMVILAAPELLSILAPGSYQAAVWVVPPVTVSVYFMFLYNLFATFEYYFEKTHYVAMATIVGAVLNVILNALLIPKFGFVAAGYTTLVCYILYACAHYHFMCKVNSEYLPGEKIYNVGIILALGGVLLVSALLIMLLYPMPAIRYGMLLLILAMAFWKRKALIGIIRKMR